jgi:hypothetical protein
MDELVSWGAGIEFANPPTRQFTNSLIHRLSVTEEEEQVYSWVLEPWITLVCSLSQFASSYSRMKFVWL